MKWLTSSTTASEEHGPIEAISSPDEKSGTEIKSQAIQGIHNLQKNHQHDPNLPEDEVEALKEAAKTNNLESVVSVEKAFTEESPYDSVRAAVRNTDGEEVANTLRAWILGFLFVTVAAAVNMFLSMRSPAITIPTVVIMLLVYPIGCFWARVMPAKTFNTFGLTWTLNPGPFTIKEVSRLLSMPEMYCYDQSLIWALVYSTQSSRLWPMSPMDSRIALMHCLH